MQLRERAPVVVAIVIVGCATVFVALAIRPHERPRWRCGTTAIDLPAVPSFERAVPPAAVRDVVDVETRGIPAADRLYRARRFDEAANVALAAGQLDPEVASLAALYAQAARAWSTTAIIELSSNEARRNRIAPLFEQLRELRKLDTVLGAPFEAELDVKLAGVATEAAAEYLSSARYADAAAALATADALGITGPRIDRLHAELARHRAETF